MAARASRWNMKKRDDSGKVDMELDLIGHTPDLELSVDADRMYRLLPPLFKSLLNTSMTTKTLARLEGRTRQAIESKLRYEVQAVRNQFSEYEGLAQ